MGALGRVRRTLLVGLAALAVVAVVPAGARLVRATASHCPKGSTLLRLGKSIPARGVCLKAGRPRAADAWGSVPFLEHLASTLQLGSGQGSQLLATWVTGSRARSDYARAVRALAQLPAPSFPSLKPRARPHAHPHARPAKVTTSVVQRPFSEDGWKGTATEAASIIEPDPGAPGQAGYDAEKQIVAHNGPATMTLPDHERLLFAGCPTVEGEVPGTFSWSNTKTISVPYADGTGTIVQHTQIEAKVLAHTTDKGMVRDYDIDMTYHTYAQGIVKDKEGHVVNSDDPGLWTLHLVRRGLHIDGDRFKELDDGGTQLGQVIGPGGVWVGAIPTAHLDVAQDAVRKLMLVVLRSAPMLKTLENDWQDSLCIKPDFTSSDLSISPHLASNGQPNGGQVATMKPGQAAHLSVRVSAPYGGKLAAGDYSATLDRFKGGDKGRLSPTGGRYAGKPLPFKYSSPSKNWSKPDDEIAVSVVVTSHQGRGLGYLNITPAPTSHYLKTVAVNGSMDYEANYPLNRYQGDTCAATGSEKYTLSTGGQSGTGQPTDGQVSDGGAYVSVPAHLNGTQDYSDPCSYPSTADDPCHADLADDTVLAVSILHDSGAPSASVQISAFGRDFPADAYCHDRFGDDWVQNDDQHLNTQVAWSTLNGTKPFTISGSDRVADSGGRSVTRQVSITLQPVDQNGRALS